MIGLRIICYFESDIKKIARILKRNFKSHSVTDKTQILHEKIDSFGYQGYHMDLSLSEERKKLKEYKKIAEIKFEVQIRTIVQDAWSELDHKLKYKNSVSDNIKRSISRLAAIFELSESL
ncbi:MAG: hypothetical protein IPK03_03320 [Bacteroidetes bacterium]|nr:hypothetical protein [Bacteroidota bacterium]